MEAEPLTQHKLQPLIVVRTFFFKSIMHGWKEKEKRSFIFTFINPSYKYTFLGLPSSAVDNFYREKM